jgi:cytochrome bd-type quinol oxidase subunit 2
MGKKPEDRREFSGRDRWLTFAFLLGPLSALSHLTVSYSLVQTSCEQKSKAMLHATTVGFLLLCALAGIIAWRILRNSDGSTTHAERTRWLAVVSLVLAVSSAVVIVAMQLPNFILGSCD